MRACVRACVCVYVCMYVYISHLFCRLDITAVVDWA